MTIEMSKYSVFSIRGLPAGVWGESYVVITAFESRPGELTTEFFIMTTRPKEALTAGTIKIAVEALPQELGKIDIEFALQEGLHQSELSLLNLLETRATELSRPDVEYMQFDLKPCTAGDLLGCWMRGQFNLQIKTVQAKTQCRQLAQYLGLFSQVGIIVRDKDHLARSS